MDPEQFQLFLTNQQVNCLSMLTEGRVFYHNDNFQQPSYQNNDLLSLEMTQKLNLKQHLPSQSRNTSAIEGIHQQPYMRHVPKTLSCVFPIQSSQKSTISTRDFYATQQQNMNEQRPLKIEMQNPTQIGSCVMAKKRLSREQLIRIQSNEWKQAVASGASHMNAVEQPPYDALILEVEKEERRRSIHNGEGLRLEPETIDSLVIDNIEYVPISALNERDKQLVSCQKANDQLMNSSVAYGKRPYSLKPVQVDSLASLAQTLQFEVYEPVSQILKKQENISEISYQESEEPRTKQIRLKNILENAILSIKQSQKESRSQSEAVARRLSYTEGNQQALFGETSPVDQQYIAIRDLRVKLAKSESIIKDQDRQIKVKGEEIGDLKLKLKELASQNTQLSNDLQKRDDIVRKLQLENKLLLEKLQLQVRCPQKWEAERNALITAQQQVSKVCQDQLQSFDELNKKSQLVIERLEKELRKNKEELNHANTVIHQQHEMYYQLYNSYHQLQSITSLSESSIPSFPMRRPSTINDIKPFQDNTSFIMNTGSTLMHQQQSINSQQHENNAIQSSKRVSYASSLKKQSSIKAAPSKKQVVQSRNPYINSPKQQTQQQQQRSVKSIYHSRQVERPKSMGIYNLIKEKTQMY